MRKSLRLFGAACLLFQLTRASFAYSVLTHEQLIDLTWKDLLQPLVLKRFPKTSAAELQLAHSYAYGGCAIQDLGYYPFSNSFFSDLTHYVRSGDFVSKLLDDSQNANEYAFALGALSHYVGDNVGHQDAINPATAIAFPNLEKKYGASVTYDESPHAHIRTEFAFDIDQLSKHRLAPGAYLRFIGLRVPSRLLAQAFEETYSFPLLNILGPHRPAIRSYRSAVRSFLPRIAYAETVNHRQDFPPDLPGTDFDAYLEHIARADFQTIWNRYRRQPGIQTRLVAIFIRIVPKIGVLSDLAIKIPTPKTQGLYIESVNRTIDTYTNLLRQLAASGRLEQQLPNRDLDTGEKSRPGAYALTDTTYGRLVHKLTTAGQPIGPDLKKDILDYYSDPGAPIVTKKKPKAWAQLVKELDVLRSMPNGPSTTSPSPSNSPRPQ